MAKYKVLERSFINHRIHEAGEVVEITFTDGGTPGPNLQAVKAGAKVKKTVVVETTETDEVEDTESDESQQTDLT